MTMGGLPVILEEKPRNKLLDLLDERIKIEHDQQQLSSLKKAISDAGEAEQKGDLGSQCRSWEEAFQIANYCENLKDKVGEYFVNYQVCRMLYTNKQNPNCPMTHHLTIIRQALSEYHFLLETEPVKALLHYLTRSFTIKNVAGKVSRVIYQNIMSETRQDLVRCMNVHYSIEQLKKENDQAIETIEELNKREKDLKALEPIKEEPEPEDNLKVDVVIKRGPGRPRKLTMEERIAHLKASQKKAYAEIKEAVVKAKAELKEEALTNSS